MSKQAASAVEVRSGEMEEIVVWHVKERRVCTVAQCGLLCFKSGRPGADQTGARRRLICGIWPMSRDCQGVAGERGFRRSA